MSNDKWCDFDLVPLNTVEVVTVQVKAAIKNGCLTCLWKKKMLLFHRMIFLHLDLFRDLNSNASVSWSFCDFGPIRCYVIIQLHTVNKYQKYWLDKYRIQFSIRITFFHNRNKGTCWSCRWKESKEKQKHLPGKEA